MNPDLKRVTTILNGLKHNEEKYGAKFCPCKPEKINDNVCPCTEYRETKRCVCKLYLPYDTMDIVYFMKESYYKYGKSLCYFEPDNLIKVCPCKDIPCYYD